MKNDIVEIINYHKAMLYGQQDLVDRDYHFSKNFVCNLHAILMKNNVRGAHKAPGRFKIEQNYFRNDELGNFTSLPTFLTDEYIENLIEYNDIRSPACANAIFRCEHRLLIQVVNTSQSGLPLQRSLDACIIQ